MYHTDAVGYIRVASGHHPMDCEGHRSWVIETEQPLNDIQMRALINMKDVVSGAVDVKSKTRRQFTVTVQARNAAAGAEIVKQLIDRFIKFLDRQLAQQQTAHLAVHSDVSRYDGQ